MNNMERIFIPGVVEVTEVPLTVELENDGIGNMTLVAIHVDSKKLH